MPAAVLPSSPPKSNRWPARPKATTEISEQIAAIQAASDQTVTAIQNVANVIGEIDQIGTAIAAAIEEQGSATREISRSVQEAARGTSEVNSNISGVQKA